MKKLCLIFLSSLLCSALLAGCSCQHDWMEATCLSPKICTKCDATEGQALGHSWQEATCVAPETCTRCELTEGSALGHDWEEASCTDPKTCRSCSATEGQALGHTWEGEATLFTAPLCTVCAAEGQPLPGYFVQQELVPNAWPDQSANYVTNTYVRPDLNTTGLFLASNVQVFEADSTHRARQGYEWRSVDISIVFNDNHSGLYGTNVTYARADYYQDMELKKAKKQESFTVTYKDKKYNCLAFYEDAGFYLADDGNVFHLTCYVQVPAGYDGVVLTFYHSSIDIDGAHLHEVEDENMLLLRMA